MTQHDFVISDAPGLPIRLDLQAAVQALATCSSGPDAPATTYAGQLWLNTSVPPNGQLRMRNQANDAWIDIAGFPGKASSAEAIAGTNDDKYVTPAGIAARDLVAPQPTNNRFINPALQISQENGDTAGTATSFWPADMWLWSYTGAGAVVSVSRINSVTPNGSQKRFQAGVSTAKASLAANDYAGVFLRVETPRFNDFGWGNADAKRTIIRFGFRAPAGTYALALRSGATPTPRCYVAPITISAAQANTDTEQIFVIPGDTQQSWNIGVSNIAVDITITLAAGTTYLGAPNVWANGSLIGVTGMSNGLATVGNTFQIWDIGLYADPWGTGKPPLWEQPDEPSEMLLCQRYYVADVYTHFHGPTTSGTTQYGAACFPVDMRASFTFVGTNFAVSNYPATPGAAVLTTMRSMREPRVSTATANSAVFMTAWNVSARM